LGSGLPTVGNVHEVAQEIDPTVRVVYVDNDPMVLVHADAVLATNDTTTVITTDIRRPQEILDNPEIGIHIDFNQPIGLLLFAILHHINDWEDPEGISRTLRDALPSGSYVALSHFCDVSEEHPRRPSAPPQPRRSSTRCSAPADGASARRSQLPRRLRTA
jgi:hypothetical protein